MKIMKFFLRKQEIIIYNTCIRARKISVKSVKTMFVCFDKQSGSVAMDTDRHETRHVRWNIALQES